MITLFLKDHVLMMELYSRFHIFLLSSFCLFIFSASAANTDLEEQKIMTLIEAVRSSKNHFIRNGSEHSAAEAADHLLSKYKTAKRMLWWKKLRGEKVDFTVDTFIEKIASTSSSSGKEYRIKLTSGETVSAQAWFTEQKNRLEKGAEKGAKKVPADLTKIPQKNEYCIKQNEILQCGKFGTCDSLSFFKNTFF
jgi:hypothetical protein